MTTLLIKNAHLLTMDDHHTELSDGGLFIEDGFIEQVGLSANLPQYPPTMSTYPEPQRGGESIEAYVRRTGAKLVVRACGW